MAPSEDDLKKRVPRKLTKRRKHPNRLPSSHIPERLRQGGDDQEDVTAPAHSVQGGPQYMNQSIFSMIAAAGSRTDFHARFDESSDSEEEVAPGRGRTHDVKGRNTGQRSILTSDGTYSSGPRDSIREKPSFEKVVETHSTQSRPEDFTKGQPTVTSKAGSRAARSESRSRSPPDRSPHAAPMMSRLLSAQAELAADNLSNDESLTHRGKGHARKRTDSSPATLLASRLMEIFGFEKPERVVSEYACWLLQSVLLQGYMYITQKHICFYAYLPKKSNTVSKTGHLSKRGRQNRKYHRYWFTLKGDVLSYYSNPSDVYFPHGQVDLRYGISASLTGEKDGRDFSVTTDHRTYHFRADSAISAKEWVKTLQKVIFRSHNDGDSVKISLPIANIIDVEESPVVEFAETIKIRVIESGESYAMDEYFFSFFSSGKEALHDLSALVADTPAQRISQDLLSPANYDDDRAGRRGGSPVGRRSTDVLTGNDRGRSTTPLRESVRATLTPLVGDDGARSSRRPSAEFLKSGRASSRSSVDLPKAEYSRASFDRGRRSGSTGRLSASRDRQPTKSPLVEQHGSSDSFVQSLDKETESSVATFSFAEGQGAASQILSGSAVFHTPTLDKLETIPSGDPEPVPRHSEDTARSNSGKDNVEPRKFSASQTDPLLKTRGPRTDLHVTTKDLNIVPAEKVPRNTSSPNLQDLVKAGSYPLQRAAGFAGYLKSRSSRMSRLLASESMGYIEKVSGMWQGGRKHYGDNEGLLPDDRLVDAEDEEASVGHGDRFRAHFALPASEKLQATYFGYLMRVLPLYGKIYISNRKFCFRSLLPGTKTKLILPLKDIESVDKEKGFRFGYHGLVLTIRGHEELFFEFNSSELRDDCTGTLWQNIESVQFMLESGLLAQQDQDDAEVAKAEHDMLQAARKSSAVVLDPHKAQPGGQRDNSSEAPPVFFDDPRASIINFKPTQSLRITCLTIGSRGDVQPYIAFCKGLLKEGHKPRIATHAEFQPWVEEHGIAFKPVDGDPAELMRICVENGMFTYSFLKEASHKFRGWIDELLTSAWHACQDSDILIESPSAMAGIHIAEALEIPYFRAFTMPWTRTRAYPHAFAVPEHKIGGAYNYFSYVMFDNVFWKAIAGQVNRWRQKELGLPSTNLDKLQPNKVPFLYNFSPHVVVPPLDYSDWVRVTGYWFLDEGNDWTAPEALTTFIKTARTDGKKLVYIGFGSIVVSDPAALTRTVVDSVLKADVRCILSKGWSDRLGDPAAVQTEVPLPPEIHQIKSAPHDWLFKQVDAAVHHGGAGTTGASLRAGVPTIIKPFFGDQFFFGSRVEDLGVGICLKKINLSLLSRALWEAVHSERMLVKAKLLGELIRKENGVENAIEAVYRDLEYAKMLIKVRASTSKNRAGTQLEDNDAADIEESWTFIGDESDPELRKKIQDWDISKVPRIGLNRMSSGGLPSGEVMERKGSKSRR